MPILRAMLAASSTSDSGIDGETPVTAKARSPSASKAAAATYVLSTPPEKAMMPEQAWEAVSIDERWQLEQWGSDEEAAETLENRRRDFMSAAGFLELLDA